MVRPLLLEAPPVPRQRALLRARAFLLESWAGRVVALAFALGLLQALLGLAGRELPAALRVPASIVRWLFAAWLAWRVLRWLSDRLLWRIRTKLFVSYLFIALVPVVLLTLFMTVAGILLLGFTASRVVTADVERTADVLLSTARTALAGLPAGDAEAARELPARLASAGDLNASLGYTLLRSGRVVAAAGEAPRAVPAWLAGPSFKGLSGAAADGGRRDVLRALWRDGSGALILELPVDAAFLAEVEKRTTVHVLDTSEMAVEERQDGGRRVRMRRSDSPSVEIEAGGRKLKPKDPSGLLFLALPDQTDWQTGERGGSPWPIQYDALRLVKHLAPIQLPRDTSGRSVPELLLYALGIVGGVFVFMYAVALALGLMLARSITRGVHELSVGTQKLREGDFTHVIQPRSRDQLGDLAASFNLMSRGIQQLMVEQADKERLEEELRIARQIQMSLLPGEGLVSVPGVRIAALCLPAAEVGGDYYDLLPLTPTRMGVLVADVSGKGTSAALYMAELKGLVLSLSRIYDSPARLLSEANRILSAHMDARSFVTMTYAVVDSAARCMRYARAGHNPLIQLSARTGQSAILAPAGLGLGLDPGERFEAILEEAEVALEPGDFFLFFTDGLSEAMNPASELFGEGRLRHILEESHALGSEELRERILEEVRRFVGDALPHDDMTLVVLKVVAEGPAA
ncbi:MAG: PP2C family protein-serine/threonine phosphatase [Burkholderiales bacterium]